MGIYLPAGARCSSVFSHRIPLRKFSHLRKQNVLFSPAAGGGGTRLGRRANTCCQDISEGEI